MATEDKFLPAQKIAAATGVSKRTILRRAAAERWPMERRGNRFYYIPPRRLMAGRLGPTPQPAIGATFPLALSVVERGRMRRAWRRYEAVCALEDLLTSQVPVERALHQVARDFTFHTSETSLRSWRAVYRRQGFQGLQEHKVGRVGRKPSTPAT